MVNAPTNYLNSKQRRIFHGDRGGYFVRTASGKSYDPKAGYRKAGGEGATVKITAGRNNTSMIPAKIRPAARKGGKLSYKTALVGRKVRKNKGVRRVVRATPMSHGPNQGYLLRLMDTQSRRRKVGPRKVRKNKGVRRVVRATPMSHGPNQGYLQRLMDTQSRRRKVGPRKVRKNKGVRRVVRMNYGPDQGAVQRRMNAASARAAQRRLMTMLSPLA
jgi:hypothetical protein